MNHQKQPITDTDHNARALRKSSSFLGSQSFSTTKRTDSIFPCHFAVCEAFMVLFYPLLNIVKMFGRFKRSD